MEELVERHVGPVVGKKMPGVAVAIVQSEAEHVFALGGVAAHRRPREDCWEIGSITKVFTGTLLAEMSLRGEVALDDPLGVHMPSGVAVALPPLDRQPTLEDLATHHAGFRSIPTSWLMRMWRAPDPYARLSDAMVLGQLGADTRQPEKPKYRYSNYGMGLLGLLLERAGGQPLATLMRDRLLDPLGLDQTGLGSCGPGSTPVQGYRKGRHTPAWTFGSLAGAGAMRSTVADLSSFARSVLAPSSGRVGDALRLAIEPRRKAGRDLEVGLGWMTRRMDSGDAIWHNGGTYGASSFLAVVPDRSVAVIALGNGGPGLVPRLDGACWALLDEL